MENFVTHGKVAQKKSFTVRLLNKVWISVANFFLDPVIFTGTIVTIASVFKILGSH